VVRLAKTAIKKGITTGCSGSPKMLAPTDPGVNRDKNIKVFLENDTGMIYYHTGGDKNDSFKNCNHN